MPVTPTDGIDAINGGCDIPNAAIGGGFVFNGAMGAPIVEGIDIGWDIDATGLFGNDGGPGFGGGAIPVVAANPEPANIVLY